MIYKATWMDGRELVLRAHDAEMARRRAFEWRQYDPMYDGDVDASVFTLTHVESRASTAIITAGWTPAAYAGEHVVDPVKM
jgi:hypothetical protein